MAPLVRELQVVEGASDNNSGPVARDRTINSFPRAEWANHARRPKANTSWCWLTSGSRGLRGQSRMRSDMTEPSHLTRTLQQFADTLRDLRPEN